MSSTEPQDGSIATASNVNTPEALFAAHARAVFAVCLANTHHHHDAEDVMQSVFLKANEKMSSLREPERARSWLLQTARRACIDFHRRKRPTESLVEEPATTPTDDTCLSERLQAAMSRLPQNAREVIALYYMEEQTCSRVAESLGLTEQAVRQRLVRARAMLHDLLKEDQA